MGNAAVNARVRRRATVVATGVTVCAVSDIFYLLLLLILVSFSTVGVLLWTRAWEDVALAILVIGRGVDLK